MIALHERVRSGFGQHVDVSAQQAVTIATQSDIVAARVGGEQDRGLTRYAGGGVVGPFVFRFVYPAADGYVSISHLFGSTIGPGTQRMMQLVWEDGFCDEAMRDKDWIGYGELLFSEQEPTEEWERAKAAVEAWTSSKTKAELLELAMNRQLLIAPITMPRDTLESPQLAARGFFETLERPDGRGTMRAPGPWAKPARSPLHTGRRAPRLGEHTSETLAEIESSSPQPMPKGTPGNGLPLEGVKILDFMWAMADPLATRILAD